MTKDTPISKQLKKVAEKSLSYIDSRVNRLKKKEKLLWLSIDEGQILFITKRNNVLQVNLLDNGCYAKLTDIDKLSPYSIIKIAIELETPVKENNNEKNY